MTLQERVENYDSVMPFPKSLFIGGDGRIVGTWMMGNNYRATSPIYGAYPPGYLGRVRALSPEKQSALHLFSGAVVDTAFPKSATVDIHPDRNPDYLDDAQSLENVPVQDFDLILADPPYSVEDAEHYQTTMIKRNKVMRALGDKAADGTHVVWLDQVLPMYRKDQWDLQGLIGMVRSTNHRFRVVSIFRRRSR